MRSVTRARCFIPGLVSAGQRRLAQGHVAVVGCGATGAAAAALLARAGVGTLTLVDRDFVEESNLQRQVLFDEADAREALPKAEAARRKIAQFNSRTEVHAHVADLVPSNIHALLGEAAILLDATDNFETRYLLNDYAVEQGRPWIYAAAVGAYAATMNILPGRDGLPGMPLSPAAGGHGGNLRHFRHFEHGGQFRRVGRSDRGVEVSGGRAGQNAAHPAGPGSVDQ